MLQQTGVGRVGPAFERFVRRFPDVRALASAPRAAVVEAWDGLGYNRRAVALHRAALAIARDHHGRVPRDRVALQALPGIGPYTASAVLSIAFGEPVAAVDTNARRVVARFLHGGRAEGIAPAELAADAGSLLAVADPGAWNQALMDLGREVCRPAPRCGGCPLAPWCASRGAGRADPRESGSREAFEGSFRQVRGAVVRALRGRRSASVADLSASCARLPAVIEEAVAALERDGLVERARSGRVRLPVG
jgi:A/G-specific adenine glycosylase